MAFQVGDRVRHSGYHTMKLRDYWNNQGDYARKIRAKDALDTAIAERGTVVELLHNGVKVQWDNGSFVSSLDYLVMKE